MPGRVDGDGVGGSTEVDHDVVIGSGCQVAAPVGCGAPVAAVGQDPVVGQPGDGEGAAAGGRGKAERLAANQRRDGGGAAGAAAGGDQREAVAAGPDEAANGLVLDVAAEREIAGDVDLVVQCAGRGAADVGFDDRTGTEGEVAVDIEHARRAGTARTEDAVVGERARATVDDDAAAAADGTRSRDVDAVGADAAVAHKSDVAGGTEQGDVFAGIVNLIGADIDGLTCNGEVTSTHVGRAVGRNRHRAGGGGGGIAADKQPVERRIDGADFGGADVEAGGTVDARRQAVGQRCEVHIADAGGLDIDAETTHDGDAVALERDIAGGGGAADFAVVGDVDGRCWAGGAAGQVGAP